VDPAIFHLKDINGVNLTSQGANSTQSKLPTSAPGYGNEIHLRGMKFMTQGTCASDATRFSRACYRQNSLRLWIQVTDEDYDQDPTWNNNTYQPTVDQVSNADITMIGVWSDSSFNTQTLRDDMASLVSMGKKLIPVLTSFMIGTPACNALGTNPFYVKNGETRAIVRGDNADSANAITCAVQAVTRFVPQDVVAKAKNDPSNVDALGAPVDAPSAFVERVEVFMAGPAACPTYNTLEASDGAGFPEVIVGILPGKNVCWKIHVKPNVSVMPSMEPQMFRATVEVTGKGGSLLDARDVFFLVPPMIPDPPID